MKKLRVFYSNINNFGDKITPFLLKKVFNLSFTLLNRRRMSRIGCSKDFLMGCGSLLSRNNLNNSYIWGTGMLKEVAVLKGKPKKIYAVRGTETRKIMLKNGIDCPENYCDPCYLLKKTHPKKIEKKYELGCIPHFVDERSEFISSLISKKVKIINVKGNIDKVIEETKSCKNIISSSLHGVILADTFNIPRLPIKISDKVWGGDFKFLDYGYSVNLGIPRFFVDKNTKISQLLNQCKAVDIDIEERIKFLMVNFPNSLF